MKLRLIGVLTILVLSVSATAVPVSAAVKAGAKCKVVGQIKVKKNEEFTCIAKGKKLVWDKGVKSNSSDKGITVDKNLFSVNVTVPASFYAGTKITQDELNADTAKKGYGKAKLNADGSVSFRMSKSQHKAALADMKKSIEDFLQESVNDSPKIFREITYNKKISEFSVSVNKANFEEDFAAGMIGWGIGILSTFYQMFDGAGENPKTVIKIIDQSTGKVFDTQTWPEKDK